MAWIKDDGTMVCGEPYSSDELSFFHELEDCFQHINMEFERFLHIIDMEKKLTSDAPNDLAKIAPQMIEDMKHEGESFIKNMEKLIHFERKYRYKIW